MPISHKHKLIFIHIPKNAGTSICKNLDTEDVGHHKYDYYVSKYPKEWNEYKKIAIIRNPWSRTVSNYEYGKMSESYWHSFTKKTLYGPHPDYELLKNMSFEECVNSFYEDRTLLKHHGWSLQYNYITDQNKNIVVDILIDCENVNSEFKKLFNIDLININQSKHKDYKEYYNDDLINKISQIYKKDIQIFNFKY